MRGTIRRGHYSPHSCLLVVMDAATTWIRGWNRRELLCADDSVVVTGRRMELPTRVMEGRGGFPSGGVNVTAIRVRGGR